MKALSPYCHDPADSADMLRLSESKDRFQAEITGKFVGLLDLLTKKYPSCRPPLAALLQLSQRIMPRYYTIASSNQVHNSEIRIAISLTMDEVPDSSEKRLGLASRFL